MTNTIRNADKDFDFSQLHLVIHTHYKGVLIFQKFYLVLQMNLYIFKHLSVNVIKEL
jgi:hypothetical protein